MRIIYSILFVGIFPLLGMEKAPTTSKSRDTIAFLQHAEEPFRLKEGSTNFAREKIQEGNQILKKIAANPGAMQAECKKMQQSRQELDEASFLTQQKMMLDQIVAIAWAIYNKAVEKGEGFTGGTIVIIDPEYALFNFLFNYVCFVNPTIVSGKNPSLIISNNPFGYSRLSTHFVELQKLKNFEGHYGIDMRYDEGNLQPLLPGNKQHILFGKLSHLAIPLTFIKFETYGLKFEKKEMLKHVEKAVQKGKKDILKSHKKLFSRREDVPEEVKNRFRHLFKRLPKEEQIRVKAELSKQFKHIRSYYALAKKLAAQSQKYSQEAKQFVEYLERHYDHLDVRRGDEVILELKEFV